MRIHSRILFFFTCVLMFKAWNTRADVCPPSISPCVFFCLFLELFFLYFPGCYCRETVLAPLQSISRAVCALTWRVCVLTPVKPRCSFEGLRWTHLGSAVLLTSETGEQHEVICWLLFIVLYIRYMLSSSVRICFSLSLRSTIPLRLDLFLCSDSSDRTHQCQLN